MSDVLFEGVRLIDPGCGMDQVGETPTDERGGLRPGVSVVITKRTGGSVSWVRTDDEGRYRLPLPAAGSYDLTAVDRGVGTSRSQILTVGGQSLTVDLQLDQPGSLLGPVESD